MLYATRFTGSVSFLFVTRGYAADAASPHRYCYVARFTGFEFGSLTLAFVCIKQPDKSSFNRQHTSKHLADFLINRDAPLSQEQGRARNNQEKVQARLRP